MLVTVHVFTVPTRHVPSALRRVAVGRTRLRGLPGVTFAKTLGTSASTSFAPYDADLRRWALLTCWQDPAAASGFDDSALLGGWRGLASEVWQLTLIPLSSKGFWSKRQPFDPVEGRLPDTQPLVVLTRARLRLRRALPFWRAAPGVAAELGRADGCLLAMGVGEAPMGLQGTLSAWRSVEALEQFARGAPAHVEAMRRTRTEGWYAEELFARFAVHGSSGTLDGRDPLAGLVATGPTS